MAGRFTVRRRTAFEDYSRTYRDTPAGRLEAAQDKAADVLRLHGHQMMYWRKEAALRPSYVRATCRACGAGVKVAAGMPLANLPGYPSLLRLRKVQWCPGKRGRR